jgi:hypothetical protein
MMRRTAFKILISKLQALRLLLLLLILPLNLPAPGLAVQNLSGERRAIAHDPNLQSFADALLPLFEKMPPVPVFVEDAPVVETGSSIERGVAFTECESSENPAIFVKKAFYEKANRKQLGNIIKHELTHAWLCRQNLMAGHDELFRRKFESVGGFGN